MNNYQTLPSIKRLLGLHKGQKDGPFFVVMAAIHGNEAAGIYALKRVFRQLKTLNVPFCGHFLGLTGNVRAVKQQKRFIDVDLNRQWDKEKTELIFNTPTHALEMSEELEQKELLNRFYKYRNEFKEHYHNRNMVLLDLHTFSAKKGGAYSIATKNGESQHWAARLNVPTIIGLETVIKGTTMHFFNDFDMTSFCFEAGQHDDPLAVDRMESALWLTLCNIGCINKKDVPNYDAHYRLLHKIGENLPQIVEFSYRHAIVPSDNFEMKKGYTNFMTVKKGEILATDKNGVVCSPVDGMILMPLYQKQGEDGFFIVKKVK
ncbi:MAG: succinylglutamate desuccinylase/aspartoacylase family protein [Chitinophagales bacterium]